LRSISLEIQEGKKVHTGGGFSGRGFKFDETEAQSVNERKKFQKAALGKTFFYLPEEELFLCWH